jgi:heme-degrading monooxygenase HmoA
MITRIWHGRTKAAYADAYLAFLQRTGIPDYLKTPGILSVKILRRLEGEICHFCTVTEWSDVERVKGFAGDEYEKAKYYAEDANYLLEFEERVLHYETYIAGGSV